MKQLSNGKLGETAIKLTEFEQAIDAEKSEGKFLPRCVQLDWCICSVKDNFKVVEVVTVIVNPGVQINIETTQKTGVTQQKVESDGLSFKDAIEKVSKLYN